MGIGNIGLPGLLLIAVVVLVLFGRGKISSLMGEVGKGITAFKKGVSEGGKDEEDAEPARRIEQKDEVAAPAVHTSESETAEVRKG